MKISLEDSEEVINKKLDEIEEISYKLDKIRRDRISEIDDILELFQGRLTLDDILNQDYSLITDLSFIRKEKLDKLNQAQTPIKKRNEEYINLIAQTQLPDTKPKSSKKTK